VTTVTAVAVAAATAIGATNGRNRILT
jgi:hypothetical protein